MAPLIPFVHLEVTAENLEIYGNSGAQGGGIADIKPCFNADGRGAIITASRSIIYAFDAGESDWAGSIRRAAETTHRELSDGLRACTSHGS